MNTLEKLYVKLTFYKKDKIDFTKKRGKRTSESNTCNNQSNL
jgi:hypothetical protein